MLHAVLQYDRRVLYVRTVHDCAAIAVPLHQGLLLHSCLSSYAVAALGVVVQLCQ